MPHAQRVAAKRSYPMSKVMGSSRECQADGAGMAERSFPASEVRGGGREDQPCVLGSWLHRHRRA